MVWLDMLTMLDVENCIFLRLSWKYILICICEFCVGPITEHCALRGNLINCCKTLSSYINGSKSQFNLTLIIHISCTAAHVFLLCPCSVCSLALTRCIKWKWSLYTMIIRLHYAKHHPFSFPLFKSSYCPQTSNYCITKVTRYFDGQWNDKTLLCKYKCRRI